MESGIASCSRCGSSREASEGNQCSSCGCTLRTFHVTIGASASGDVLFGLKAKRPGPKPPRAKKKKPFYELIGGAEWSAGLGQFVQKLRILDRVNDWYHEHVFDRETGWLLHRAAEPLSK